MSHIEIDTLVSRTGVVPQWNANLASIRTMSFAEIPRQRTICSASLEGMIEIRIDGVLLLGQEHLDFWYVDSYWEDALIFVASLMQMKSTKWQLGGMKAHIWCDRLPGTRRADIQLVICGEVAAAVGVHIPTLAEALLDGAEEYFNWLPETQSESARAETERLRKQPAPWRPNYKQFGE